VEGIMFQSGVRLSVCPILFSNINRVHVIAHILIVIHRNAASIHFHVSIRTTDVLVCI